jgi:hypothetical protein
MEPDIYDFIDHAAYVQSAWALDAPWHAMHFLLIWRPVVAEA